MGIILSNPNLVNSAKHLRDFLNDRTTEKWTVEKNIDEPIIDKKYDYIYWGINKGYTRVGLGEVLTGNNVYAIKYKITEPEQNDYPIVIRTVLNGNQGNGIVIAKNNTEYRPYRGNYWSNWISFEFELGVHCINGVIQRVFKKVCMDDEREFPIRNVSNNYHFAIRDVNKYKKLPEFVSKLHTVLNFEIVRYDIGWDKENKRYCCIEANTAPSLSNNIETLTMYGDYFISKLGLERR